MEPADLKSNPPDDAALEAWLRANGSLPTLPDAGFSTRVLVALPPPFHRRIQRSVGCFAAVILGSTLAVIGVLGSGRAVVDALFVSLENPLAAPPALIALAVTAGSLWFAFRDRLRLLPRR